MDISIAFDPASMAKLEHLLNVDFGKAYTPAMSESLNLLQNYAVDFMFANFQNPTGQLEGAFVQTITPGLGEITGELANPEAYARRRNDGFSGMTDSLGRYFPDDPGISYMDVSLANNEQGIFDLFIAATEVTLLTLGIL